MQVEIPREMQVELLRETQVGILAEIRLKHAVVKLLLSLNQMQTSSILL